MSDYERQRVNLSRDGQVATMTIKPRTADQLGDAYNSRETTIHWQVADAIDELRADNDIRVIVLTSPEEGEGFFGHTRSAYKDDTTKQYQCDPRRLWLTFTGIVRAHMGMAEIEKPIVAKVHGDATGFGQSLVWASDLIVANEDAVIADQHMGMAEIAGVGPEYGIIPGDGGVAHLPLYMTPPKAKEYLMLAKPYTARELADNGIINYAVPADDLDDLVDDLVERLLKRSAYALAWTKRTANRRVVDHLNTVLDAAAAYEMVTFLQAERMGWEDTKELVWGDM